MRVHSLRLVAVSAALVLAACGTDSTTSTIDTTSTTRGTLIENPPLRIASLDAPTLNAELMASAAGQQLLLVTGAPACGVDFNYFHYWTVGGANETATATGALMVPTGGGRWTGAPPIVPYAHGTDTHKNRNLPDNTGPTNNEGALIAALFSAQEYIVLAPHYA